jgi:hypothetical protein
MRARHLTPILLALGLAACGGSSNTAARSPRAVTQTVVDTVTSPATTTQTTTTTEAGTVAPGACTAAQLTPSALGSNGAAGHVVLGFALRNHTEASCHTYGFPGVEFLDRAGQPIPGKIVRSTRDFAGSAPKTKLVLGPGQQASFRIVTSDVGSGACPMGASLQIIAPDDTQTMRVALSGSVLVCSHPTVSPLEAGTAAFPGP